MNTTEAAVEAKQVRDIIRNEIVRTLRELSSAPPERIQTLQGELSALLIADEVATKAFAVAVNVGEEQQRKAA